MNYNFTRKSHGKISAERKQSVKGEGASTSYPTADNNRFKLPDKYRVTFNLADFKTSCYPIPDARPYCNQYSSYPTPAFCRVNLKLPYFLNFKIPEKPTLISKVADFPDDSRLKLPDFSREMFKLPDNWPIISKRRDNLVQMFHARITCSKSTLYCNEYAVSVRGSRNTVLSVCPGRLTAKAIRFVWWLNMFRSENKIMD